MPVGGLSHNSHVLSSNLSYGAFTRYSQPFCLQKCHNISISGMRDSYCFLEKCRRGKVEEVKFLSETHIALKLFYHYHRHLFAQKEQYKCRQRVALNSAGQKGTNALTSDPKYAEQFKKHHKEKRTKTHDQQE